MLRAKACVLALLHFPGRVRWVVFRGCAVVFRTQGSIGSLERFKCGVECCSWWCVVVSSVGELGVGPFFVVRACRFVDGMLV